MENNSMKNISWFRKSINMHLEEILKSILREQILAGI